MLCACDGGAKSTSAGINDPGTSQYMNENNAETKTYYMEINAHNGDALKLYTLVWGWGKTIEELTRCGVGSGDTFHSTNELKRHPCDHWASCWQERWRGHLRDQSKTYHLHSIHLKRNSASRTSTLQSRSIWDGSWGATVCDVCKCECKCI